MLKRVPPMPASGSRFLAKLARRDAEVEELAAMVKSDPMLAGRVLQLANSGAYGRVRRIQSIPHAIAFVGVSTLRRHAISWTISGVLKRLPAVPHWSLTKYTMHAEAVATFADLLCERMPVPESEGAYVAGLLHDIGKFALCAVANDEIGLALSMRDMSPRPVTECERQMLGIDHAEISSMAAQIWNFPEAICTAIRFHHEPQAEGVEGRLTLALILSKCDAFVNGLGLSMLSSPADASKKLDIPGQERAVAQAIEQFEMLHRPAAAV